MAGSGSSLQLVPTFTILRRVQWEDASISDALVLTPEADPGHGLSPEWRSSYDLAVIAGDGVERGRAPSASQWLINVLPGCGSVPYAPR